MSSPALRSDRRRADAAYLARPTCGISRRSSAGTAKESATVLPVPDSCSDLISAPAFGSDLADHLAEGERAADLTAQELGRLRRRSLRREGCRRPAVDVTGGGEPLDRGHLAGDLGRQVRLAGDRVEAADGPGVVAVGDLADQLHHLVVAGDRVRGQLGVDGAAARPPWCRSRRARARGTRGSSACRPRWPAS